VKFETFARIPILKSFDIREGVSHMPIHVVKGLFLYHWKIVTSINDNTTPGISIFFKVNVPTCFYAYRRFQNIKTFATFIYLSFF